MRLTFDSTVKILVDAYLNDTLHHRKCEACAVGNLIRAGGYPLQRDPINYSETYWLRYIDENERYRGQSLGEYDERIALEQINATGYNAKELSKIEAAFEAGWIPYWDVDESMFQGLMAVVDVLAEIHGIDLKQREEAKLLFQKA